MVVKNNWVLNNLDRRTKLQRSVNPESIKSWNAIFAKKHKQRKMRTVEHISEFSQETVY